MTIVEKSEYIAKRRQHDIVKKNDKKTTNTQRVWLIPTIMLLHLPNVLLFLASA